MGNYGGSGYTSSGMGPGLIAGIGALSGLGSSLLSNLGAKQRQKLADQQNIKFWQMQNAYNTPAEQMARLKKAGLNPALIYGSGATNTGVAGSIAPSKPAPYNIKNPVPDILQSAMLKSQIELQNSQAGKNRAEEQRILGITPHQIDSSLSRANQDRQKAAIELVSKEIAEQSKQDKIDIIVNQALLTKEKAGFEKAKAQLTTQINKIVGVPLHFMEKILKILFSKTDNQHNIDLTDPNTWDLFKQQKN